jgi:predicted esterase
MSASSIESIESSLLGDEISSLPMGSGEEWVMAGRTVPRDLLRARYFFPRTAKKLPSIPMRVYARDQKCQSAAHLSLIATCKRRSREKLKSCFHFDLTARPSDPWARRHVSSCLLCVSLASACARVPAHQYGHSETPSVANGSERAEPRSPTPEGDRTPPATVGARSEVLQVFGFEAAVVVVPPDSQAKPLLVVAHGAGGDSAWQCERWGELARGRFFVVCPTGVALRRGEAGSYYYPDHFALEREVTAVVGAARARYGARIAREHGVYAGYSQGATMGALMVVAHGSEFSHLLLIEGGSSDWTLERARRYRSTGGESVFIVCGTPSCARHARASVPVLERAGLRATSAYAEGGGHTELGPVGDHAARLLESLVISQP